MLQSKTTRTAKATRVEGSQEVVEMAGMKRTRPAAQIIKKTTMVARGAVAETMLTLVKASSSNRRRKDPQTRRRGTVLAKLQKVVRISSRNLETTITLPPTRPTITRVSKST